MEEREGGRGHLGERLLKTGHDDQSPEEGSRQVGVFVGGRCVCGGGGRTVGEGG